jgi:hypothetical protein
VVAVRITSFDTEKGSVTKFELGMLAVHFMASRVLVPLVDCSAELQEQAAMDTTAFMRDTWPVHTSIDDVFKVRPVHFVFYLSLEHACSCPMLNDAPSAHVCSHIALGKRWQRRTLQKLWKSSQAYAALTGYFHWFVCIYVYLA